MDGRRTIEELAGLLDGETGGARAEELSEALRVDPRLAAEFEEQRQVKKALSGLGQYAAPDFMQTRVLGQIAARRAEVKRWRPRILSAALGGFVICLLSVVTLSTLHNGAGGPGGSYNANRRALIQPGVFHEASDVYAPQYWQPVNLPENVDPQLKEFLEFASDAHSSRAIQRAAEAVSPDMPEAIMVLGDEQVESGGGSR